VDSVTAAPSTDLLTRAIGGLVCLVLLDASQLLFFYPGRTDTLWAWTLQPEASAMVLGSVYAGGAYFFARVMFGAPWRAVATGFPSVIVFVWMAGIATLLHLDRFHKDTLPFGAWAALYVITPFLIPWLVVRNHRLYGAPSGPPLPSAIRTAVVVVGGVLLALGVLFLIAPDVAIDNWAWTLTPLTARITGSVIAMYATVWVAVAVHGTWAGIRIPLEAHVIGLALLLVPAIDEGALVLAVVAAVMLITSAVLSRRAA
jgi:hypothetical protein